jgi:undecaprenyl-diphosphatase
VPDSPKEETTERVERLLEKRIAQVRTPARAEAVAERIERLAAGTTEEEAAKQATDTLLPPAEAVEAADKAGLHGRASPTATALAEATAQAVAEQPGAPAVAEATRKVLRPAEPAPPAVQRGRSLLREAVLRRMGRLDRLDARLFLLLNSFHTPGLDAAADAVSVVFRGGWIWSGAVVVAGLFGAPRSGRILSRLLPSVAIATFLVEHPIKALFRRRRPFVNVIRAVVVGKKPGSWSFPSGHSASSFAAAWTLTRYWPRGAPLFFMVAGTVALSRVYVGAHYPGDVTSGAFAGMALAEGIRRLARLIRGRRL